MDLFFIGVLAGLVLGLVSSYCYSKFKKANFHEIKQLFFLER